MASRMRAFDTGALKSPDVDKIDYEGHLDPGVLRRFGEYMHKNRFLPDGSMRDSDNWKLGIPKEQYMKSLIRHVMSAWENHEQGVVDEDELCAILFNTMGYLFEHQMEKK